MGQQCSSCTSVQLEQSDLRRVDSPDPEIYDLMRKSVLATTPRRVITGQHQLLYRNQSKTKHSTPTQTVQAVTAPFYPTRLLMRQRSSRVCPEGDKNHIYAIRYPDDTKDLLVSEQSTSMAPSLKQEQCPPRNSTMSNTSNDGTQNQNNDNNSNVSSTIDAEPLAGSTTNSQDIFAAVSMLGTPSQPAIDWVTVSEEHNIYIADIGLTVEECDELVVTTENVCQGQYAAYTYAKQTLGCREYPSLMQSSFAPVHTTVHAIAQNFPASRQLQLDDREPHIVKYDVTKKERQKLDMHTDKSEWTFLIALSNGCGVDYEGGGTYFDVLDATVHIQRGHALIFPGKLRHCGKRITAGLRYLLVGFLVDKQTSGSKNKIAYNSYYENSEDGDKTSDSDGNENLDTDSGSSSSSGNSTSTPSSGGRRRTRRRRKKQNSPQSPPGVGP